MSDPARRKLPRLVALVGAAGVLPFLICAIAAARIDPAAASNPWLEALLFYAAVVLSFLGAVHWGLALAAADGADAATGQRARLLLGVLPALVAWAALLADRLLAAELGLALLIGGFIAVVVVEEQGHRRGLVPGGYMGLRWALSVVVVALLTTVLVLRLIGARIIF